MIDGVYLHPLKQIIVPNGNLYHALKSTDEGYCGFGEAYFTHIEPGKVKGWKRHNLMTLNLIVIYGKVKFVIYDDRSNSPTYGHFQEIELSPENNYQRLTIAPGLWMAFYGAYNATSIIMDIIPQPHNPSEADKKALENIPYSF